MIGPRMLAWVFVCLVALPTCTRAQPARYELGRRLRAFEQTWERTPGEEARKRCVTPLGKAVTAFFTFRFGEAGRQIDLARFALDPAITTTPERRYAESLAFFPAARFLDCEAAEIKVEIKPFYEVPAPEGIKLRARLEWIANGKASGAVLSEIDKLPAVLVLPLKDVCEGDGSLHFSVLREKEILAQGTIAISFANRLADRLDGLKSIDNDHAEAATERASIAALRRVLVALKDGKSEETDYPAAKLLGDLESAAMAAKARKQYFTIDRPGQSWVTLVGAKESFPLRLAVPEKKGDGKPPPLVVALHGAGGSENMFFDGYGAGKIAQLCAKRGWMLVAPRVGFSLRLDALLDELHNRWPFDKNRVFLIGHSMGAAQSLQAVSAHPKRYAGVVALGGSGIVKASEELKEVPFLIGVGDKDFALAGARGLKDRLGKAGVKKVAYRELRHVEHLGIVQQSLADAFTFFDEIAQPNPKEAQAPLWPQWRGPRRDGQVLGPVWPESIGEESLKLAWRVPLGPSYSGPILAEDLIFTTETKDKDTEIVYALDRATGKERWRAEWKGALRVPFFAAANGSWIRSTPAYDGVNLYVAGMRDVLVCLDAKPGTEKWRVDFVEQFKAPPPAFGCVCSPLVDGDAVFVQAGASLVKLDKATGKIIWRSLKDEGGMNGSAFSSPIMADLAGKRQLVAQTREKLVGLDPATGDVLWSQVVPSFRGMNILTPTVMDDALFTSSYGNKSWLYKIALTDGTYKVAEAWSNKSPGYMSSPILFEGHAYLHLQNRRFTCINLKTGETTWTTAPFGQYWSMVAQGDRILALDQTGDLRLIKADPKEFKLLDSRKISKAETWAHLAVAGEDVCIRELNALAVYRWRSAKKP